jgi:hypothetical protein
MHAKMRITVRGTAALLAFGISFGAAAQQAGMSFFVTSIGPGKEADLGGLEGADRQCQQLAQAAGAGNRVWHAYLSTQAADGKPAVNARAVSGAAHGRTPRASRLPRMLTNCTATTI